jgi:uroporphyrin-III C-methyltransferase
LKKRSDTVAFYMGAGNLPYICQKLIEHSKPSNTPVAVIEWGTTERQRTVVGTLQTIADIVKKAGIPIQRLFLSERSFGSVKRFNGLSR